MSDTELDALLRMLQTSHMLPAPPALEPKSWSLATAAYHTCGRGLHSSTFHLKRKHILWDTLAA